MGEPARRADPAEQLGAELARILRATLAPEPAPRWRTLAAEAKARGMTTRALRDWCTRHGVEIREGSHRDAWVSPPAIDAVVEQLPAATRAPSRKTRGEKQDDVDDALDHIPGMK